MHISTFQLNNYKSYFQSPSLYLSTGINLIVGPNHAGKTALLEGLRLDFNFNPYRSSRIQRRIESKEEVESSAKVSFTLSRKELWEILRDIRGKFGVPLVDGLLHRIHFEENYQLEKAQKFVDRVFNKESYTLDALYTRPNSNTGVLSPAKIPAIGNYKVGSESGKPPFAWCLINDEGRLKVVDTQLQGEKQFDVGVKVLEVLKDRLYNFKAERFNVGKYDLLPEKRCSDNESSPVI